MKITVFALVVVAALLAEAAQKGGKKGGGGKKKPFPPVITGNVEPSSTTPKPREKEWEEVDERYMKEKYENTESPTQQRLTDGSGQQQRYEQDIPAEKFDMNAIRETTASRICSTWGPYHFRTFHGKMFYYPGKCSYIFARECYGDSFKVILEYGDRCNNSTKCTPTTHIFLGSVQYSIRIQYNRFEVYQSGHTMPMPVIAEDCIIEPMQRYLIARATIGLTVVMDIYGSVFVSISDKMKDRRTCGLCGSCFGPASEDLMTPEGNYMIDARSFGNSWADGAKGFCSDVIVDERYCRYQTADDRRITDKATEKCAAILDLKYRQCHVLVDPNPYHEACQLDCCSQKNNYDCECSTLTEYFLECNRLGGRLDQGWRTNSLCPLPCTNGTVYSQCTTSCQPTCQNPDPVCTKVDCLEGCQCLAGQVLEHGQCILQSDCKCELKGKTYSSGQKVTQDCNTCECLKGEWKCTSNICSGRCTITGNHYISTFDGRWYQLPEFCSHYLLSLNDYSVILENVACAGSKGAIPQSYSKSSTGTCGRNIKIQTPGGTIIKLKLWLEVTVNGEEVTTLPFSVDGTFITTISSLYVQAYLPNGIQIMWNGQDSGYIIVPATFYRKTKGLCGTFNGQQSDDFLTPEGDVELEENTFSGKWKVGDSCNTFPRSPDHPCESPQNLRPSAENLCSQMFSGEFKACREVVDSTQFYEACLYELCACKEKMENCLCSQMEHYAQACAQKGVLLNWRAYFPQCGLHCSRGLIHHQCVPGCNSSCAQISLQPACEQHVCFDGCTCPNGQALGENGVCVPVETCGCLSNGKEYPAGYEQYRKGKVCKCRNGQWECSPLPPDGYTPEPIDKFTECLASEGKESVECASECPLTCSNMHNPPDCSNKICKLGCRCKRGHVLEEESGVCIKPEQCPCHHGGRSYTEGSTLQIDCNFCVCKRSQWICEKNECPGQCSVWADNHYKTFDGHIYDFHGRCDYILAKGENNNKQTFSILVHNVPCGNSGGRTCSKTLIINTEKESLTLSRFSPVPKSEEFTIQQIGLYTHVKHEIGVEVLWSRYSQLYIRVDPSWKGQLKGLCGDFDGDAANDFKLPVGGLPEVSIEKFADGWKLHDYCPVSEALEKCDTASERRQWALKECSILKSKLFEKCHAEVPLQPYFQRCVSDSCQCSGGGDCECLCTAVAVYAQECASHGISIHWRSQDLCPIQCQECDIYEPCIPICPLDTCELRQAVGTAVCKSRPCVEGCTPKTCPEGEIYNDSSSKNCIPEKDCIFITECIVNGKAYSEGEWIVDETVADPCKTCYCEKGQVQCKEQPCNIVTPPPVPECIISGWSEWMNSYEPADQNDGDFEELDNPYGSLLTKYQLPCPFEHITKVECKPVAEGYQSQDFAECSLPKGLLCKHEQGNYAAKCLDYEIRVYCQCGTETTETPLTRLLRCRADQDGWSEWMNTHKPGKSKFGEIEKIDDLSKTYDICGSHFIQDIQCRVVKTQENWYEAGQAGVTCDLENGLVCEHGKQPKGKKCYDYEVRVYCQCLSTTPTQPSYITTESPCPPGVEWSPCVFRCDQTCLAYRRKLIIEGICAANDEIDTCVPGCQMVHCDYPYLQLDEYTCVQSANCNCVWEDGSIIAAGTVVQRGCEKCECMNNSLMCEHVKGCGLTAESIISSTCPPPNIPLCDDGFKVVSDNSGPCPKYDCVQECAEGLVWYDCHASCQKTCQQNQRRDCREGCISGCFCPEGTVRDGDVCKPPHECPDRVCQGFGDPQLVSFDGAMFNFQGRGTFILANHQESTFKVRGKTDYCELRLVCIVGLEIEFEGHHVSINRGEHVKIDDNAVSYEKMPVEVGGMTVLGYPGNNMLVVIPQLSAQVYYFSTHAAFSIRVPVALFFNKTGGLCGNCNFAEDDDEIPDMCKYMVEDLGACDEDNKKEVKMNDTEVEEYCHEFSEPIFRECAKQVDPHPYHVSCAYDIKEGLATEKAVCKSLLEFTRHCCEAGIYLEDWMKKFNCYVECPEGSKYHQCHDACPQTCGNESRTDCHLYKTDGCFCPEDMIFHNGICINKAICDVCDEVGHKPGQTWEDGPCTTCLCDVDLHVVCNTQTCPVAPVCRADEMLRVINGSCCNTFKCEMKPTPTCPSPEVPKCAPGEVAKIKTVKGKCPFYICECDPVLCPPVRWPEELEPGQEIEIVNEECCNVAKVLCKLELCPEPLVCAPGLELKTLPGTCCPHYRCKPPDDVCVYTAQITVVGNEEIAIKPSDQTPKYYRPGESWQDGLCKNCTCEGQEGHYSAKCMLEQCVNMEESADYSEYVLSKVQVPGQCCPHIIRILCRDTEGNEHEIGSEWKPADNNCMTYRCEPTPLGEALKVERAITCAKCPEATEYVPPPARLGQCCGWCRPVMCEDGGENYPVGAKWNSTVQKCYSAECVRDNNNVKTVYTSPKCPKIDKACPQKEVIWDETGCCKKCNITTVPKTACIPIPATKEMLAKISSFKHPKFGACTNYQKNLNLKACSGGCESNSYSLPESNDFVNSCECCTAVDYELVDIKYDCSKGHNFKLSYKQPQRCHCVPCKGSNKEIEKQRDYEQNKEETSQSKDAGNDVFGQTSQEKTPWSEEIGQTSQEKTPWSEEIGQTSQEKTPWSEEIGQTSHGTYEDTGIKKGSDQGETDEWLKQIYENQERERELLELQRKQNGGHFPSTSQEFGKEQYNYEKEPEGLDEWSKQMWRQQQRERALQEVQKSRQHTAQSFDVKEAFGGAMQEQQQQEGAWFQQMGGHQSMGESGGEWFQEFPRGSHEDGSLYQPGAFGQQGEQSSSQHHYEERTPSGGIRQSSKTWHQSSSSSSKTQHSSSSQHGDWSSPYQSHDF